VSDIPDGSETIVRRMARAFGPGQPWAAPCAFQPANEAPEDRGLGLPIVGRGCTVERAGEAVSARALGALGPAHRLTAEAWQESHCLRAGTGTRPDRVRELVEWSARGGQATPLVRMDTALLGALSFAQLPPHLLAWIEVYALERWDRWPLVMRCALHVGLEAQATADAAARILWRRAPVSQDDRARQLRVQAVTYRQATKRAERVLRAWLDDAQARVAAALGETDAHRDEG
jgi:hypothetical protein